MQRKAMSLKAYADRQDVDGELGDQAYSQSSNLQRDAIDMTVNTSAGALAPLM